MDRRAPGAAPASPCSPRSPRSPRGVSWDAALPPPTASAVEPADGWPALAPGLPTIAEDAEQRPRCPPRPPSNDALRASWSEADLAARGDGADAADALLAAARPAPRAALLPEALGHGLRALGQALADAALGAEEEPPPGGDFLPSLNLLALSPLAVGAWD